MRHIVVLGNSVAGIKALEEIRQKDQESRLTVVACEDHLPFKRHLAADFIAKIIAEEEIYYRSNEFYKEKNINIVLGKRIVRVDTKKNHLLTEYKEHISFDVLIVTDAPQIKFPDIKGAHKTGVFTLRRLADVKNIIAVLPLIETVAIEADGLSGLTAAQAFRKRGKEVLLVNLKWPLAAAKQAGDNLKKLLEGNGVRLIHDNKIVEILGEGEVKAIRLKSGKVIAAQMVILGEVNPNLRAFQESNLEMDLRIKVNESFRTNYENIYALDDISRRSNEECCDDYEKSLLRLEHDGRIAGLSILGETPFSQPYQRLNHFKIFDQTMSLENPFSVAVAEAENV